MIIPIVTLDKIFIKPDEQNLYFLDCTRINGENSIIARMNEPLANQIDRISKCISNKEIILADDVVFSGRVLSQIINSFKRRGISVIGIISSICTEDSYLYFNEQLKYGLKTNYLMSKQVIDQICERDFYFGIAGSGILIETETGYYKSPYFKPYGNPCERASIPEEYEKSFSFGCLYRSILLWEEIDRLKQRETLIRELPEQIINTYEDNGVVRVLKKEVEKL